MDEFEFRHLLENFPVVRSGDYHADLDSSRQLTRSSESEEVKEHQAAGTSKSTRGTELNENANHEVFWGKLMLAAEQKVGAAEAERFCKAFQQVHEKLVYQLPLDVARKLINSRGFVESRLPAIESS